MTESESQSWLRALLDPRASFEVSLFGLSGRLRIAPPWNSSFGPLDEHLLYFVAEGGFEAQCDDFKRTIKAGDLVWAGRGARCHFMLGEAQNLVIWRFRLRALDAGGAALPAFEPLWHLSGARDCERWMEEIADEAAHVAPHREPRLRGLLLCLLTELLRLEAQSSARIGVLTRAQREILTRYVTQNPLPWPTPAALAARLELSPDYFTRLFRRTYGAPPRRWLLEQRIRRAAVRVLESQSGVSQIAAEMGYDDVFLFSRQFKAVMGVSPLHYREKHSALQPLRP